MHNPHTSRACAINAHGSSLEDLRQITKAKVYLRNQKLFLLDEFSEFIQSKALLLTASVEPFKEHV